MLYYIFYIFYLYFVDLDNDTKILLSLLLHHVAKCIPNFKDIQSATKLYKNKDFWKSLFLLLDIKYEFNIGSQLVMTLYFIDIVDVFFISIIIFSYLIFHIRKITYICVNFYKLFY